LRNVEELRRKKKGGGGGRKNSCGERKTNWAPKDAEGWGTSEREKMGDAGKEGSESEATKLPEGKLVTLPLLADAGGQKEKKSCTNSRKKGKKKKRGRVGGG